jgi:hypothetical protein
VNHAPDQSLSTSGPTNNSSNVNTDYGDNPTRYLLEQKGLEIRNVGQEHEGLLALSGVMGQKIETIRPLLDQIKRSQASRKRLFLNLQGQPQESIADITLFALQANKAGLLPNYRYLRSPQYKLSADSPISPTAINFFTGQWLELYALKTAYEIEAKSGRKLCPLSQVQVQLPNGDQFDLDLVFTVNGRLVWVEAKTTDSFERLLPKYKVISELICDSPMDAILLWLNYDSGNSLLATRGMLAKMTLCDLKEFPSYISGLCVKG